MGNKLLGKGLLETPGDHRQVFAVIISREKMVFLSLPEFFGWRGAIVSSVFREKGEKVVTIEV